MEPQLNRYNVLLSLIISDADVFFVGVFFADVYYHCWYWRCRVWW